MTAVFRFKWSARECAYVGSHDAHTYTVAPVEHGTGWELRVNGMLHTAKRDRKALLRLAQQLASER